jgi:hypothetical protein
MKSSTTIDEESAACGNFMAISKRYQILVVDKWNCLPDELALEERIYKYIVGDFKTDPWNASELTGIKSTYQLRVSRYDEDGSALPAGTIYMQDHPCYCTNCMEFKFSQCEHIVITGGNKRIKMKQVAAEGANRDASYLGKLFRFYQTGGQPTVQSNPVIVCIQSLSLQDVEANDNPEPYFALMRKVVERETNENGTRFGSYYIEAQLLGKVSNSESSDLNLFRIQADESGTARIVRYAFEDLFGPSAEDIENNKFNRYTFVKNAYDSVNKGYLIDSASLLYIQSKLKAIHDNA